MGPETGMTGTRRKRPLRPVVRAAGWAIALYACWMGMQAVHEAGHVLHAAASGGRVARVELPPLGFSRTDLSINPRPAFVAWGGAVWGVLLPLAVWGLCRVLCRRRGRSVARGLQFFAGFCLVANGAYLGVGWVDRVGDAGDLLRRGTPVWVLVAYSLVAVSGGLLLWHRLDAARGSGGAGGKE